MDGPISAVSTPDLIDQITELAGHLNAAQARWLALIAEFDRRKAWAEWRVKSCAYWLNWKCGLDLGAAREKLRVAARARGPAADCRVDGGGAAQLLQGPRHDPSRRMSRTRNTFSTSRCTARRVMSRSWCAPIAG